MTERPPWHGWYGHWRWRRRRERQLEREPLCAWCMDRRVVTAATVAHHAQPHRGDREKFWRGELVSLCEECHNTDAQIIERGGQPKQMVPVEGWRAE